jgi:hypothetical protein
VWWAEKHCPRVFRPSVLKTGLQKQLLDFAFFVDNVLTDYWIKLFDLHFFRHRFLVFCGGVKVACAFAGNKFDFIAHR